MIAYFTAGLRCSFRALARGLAVLRDRALALWPFGRASVKVWTAEFIESDMLPASIVDGRVIIAREGNELWSAGMICPCGCGDLIELPLLADAEPRWRIALDQRGRPSVHPSVWRRTGCRAHFWMREGRVIWC